MQRHPLAGRQRSACAGRRQGKLIKQGFQLCGRGRTEQLQLSGRFHQAGLKAGRAQIYAAGIDIFLHHRIDELRNVAPLIEIVAYAGAADILQLGRQRKLNDLAGEAFAGLAVTLLLGFVLRVALEQNVVEGVNGVFAHRLFVGAGVGDHIAARHQIKLFARKQAAQACKVGLTGKIYRDRAGENVHMEHIGHRHIHDLAADQMRLGVFAPGKFIHSQIHLKAKVADGAHNALVAQSKRIEGAGEKRHLVPLGHGECSGIRAANVDKAADLGERGGAVIFAPWRGRVFTQQEQQLFAAQAKQHLFIRKAQLLRGKQLAQIQKALVAHQRAVVGKARQQKSQQIAAAQIHFFFGFRIAAGVQRAVFQQYAHSVQRHAHHALV